MRCVNRIRGTAFKVGMIAISATSNRHFLHLLWRLHLRRIVRALRRRSQLGLYLMP